MNPSCAEFIRSLSEDEPNPQLARHAAECPSCQPVWMANRKLQLRTLSTTPLPMGPELQQLLSSRREPAKQPRRYPPAVLVMVTVTACFALVLSWLPRRDLRVTDMDTLLWPFAALAAILIAALSLFSYRGRTGLGAEPWLRWSCVVASLGAAELVVLRQVKSALVRETMHAPATDCWYLGGAVALLVAMVACAVNRSTVLIASGSSGALAGAIAGLAAFLCLHVHCPSVDAVHLGVLHALPFIAAVPLAALVGGRWLRV